VGDQIFSQGRNRPLPRFEGAGGSGLIGSGLAGLDVGYEKILAACGTAGETAQHCQLAHMGERIGNWTLKKLFGRGMERRIGGEESVEGLQRLKEAALFFGPLARLCGLPALLPNGRGQSPVKEVAHVGQDLHGKAASAVKSGKVIRRTIQSTCGPVSNGSERVAKQFAFLIHTGNYNASARLGGISLIPHYSLR